MTAKEKLQTIREIMTNKMLTPIEKLDRITIACGSTAKTGRYSIRQIETAILHHFDIDSEKLQENTRKGNAVIARQVAHYLAKEHTNETLASIGNYFGGKDHATVLYSSERIENYLAKDRHFNARHRDFINEFKN